VFARDVVASTICRDVATTSGFVVSSSDGSVVDPHEVGILSKLGDEFACAVPLSCPCYRGDRHEALLRGGVYPVGDLVRSLYEVLDGKRFSEVLAPINSFSVAFAPGILGISLICGCIG
jgi:hypothetical protein